MPAFFQSKVAKGFISPPRGLSAGAVMVSRAFFVFSTAFDVPGDKLEMMILPPFCRVHDMFILGEAAAAITADVGLMDGTAGDPDTARAITANLFFDDVAINNTMSRMSLLGGFKIGSVDYARGIALVPSADIAASASKRVELIMHYSQDY